MPEKEEKFYVPEREEERKETPPMVEIPKEDWETLKIIAQRVGGDFGMEVKLGPLF